MGNCEMLKVWLPSIVSVITLLVNIGYYTFVQPRQNFAYKRREDFCKISSELLTFLSEVVSFDDFSGVLTQIRNYSLKIHLCFKEGEADNSIAERLEEIFQMVKQRKEMDDDTEISCWNDRFRNKVRELRKNLAKFSGVL